MEIPNYRDIIELLQKGLMLEAREKILELREAALRAGPRPVVRWS